MVIEKEPIKTWVVFFFFQIKQTIPLQNVILLSFMVNFALQAHRIIAFTLMNLSVQSDIALVRPMLVEKVYR